MDFPSNSPPPSGEYISENSAVVTVSSTLTPFLERLFSKISPGEVIKSPRVLYTRLNAITNSEKSQVRRGLGILWQKGYLTRHPRGSTGKRFLYSRGSETFKAVDKRRKKLEREPFFFIHKKREIHNLCLIARHRPEDPTSVPPYPILRPRLINLESYIHDLGGKIAWSENDSFCLFVLQYLGQPITCYFYQTGTIQLYYRCSEAPLDYDSFQSFYSYLKGVLQLLGIDVYQFRFLNYDLNQDFEEVVYTGKRIVERIPGTDIELATYAKKDGRLRRELRKLPWIHDERRKHSLFYPPDQPKGEDGPTFHQVSELVWYDKSLAEQYESQEREIIRVSTVKELTDVMTNAVDKAVIVNSMNHLTLEVRESNKCQKEIVEKVNELSSRNDLFWKTLYDDLKKRHDFNDGQTQAILTGTLPINEIGNAVAYFTQLTHQSNKEFKDEIVNVLKEGIREEKKDSFQGGQEVHFHVDETDRIPPEMKSKKNHYSRPPTQRERILSFLKTNNDICSLISIRRGSRIRSKESVRIHLSILTKDGLIRRSKGGYTLNDLK